MKTFTNYEMEASLQRMEQLTEKGKLGYAIARNRRILTDSLKEYMDKRNEIIIQYGYDSGGGVYRVKAENIQAAQQAMDEYGTIEHEVPVMQVSLDDFCSGGLTSDDMYILSWMVKEGE